MQYEARARFEELFNKVPGITVSEMKTSTEDYTVVTRWMNAVVEECTNVALEERIKFSIYEISDEKVVSREYFTFQGGEKISWNKIKGQDFGNGSNG